MSLYIELTVSTINTKLDVKPKKKEIILLRTGGFVLTVMALLLGNASCAKENWVGFDWYDKGRIYVDKESRSRNGDLATIKWRMVSGNTIVTEFDCLRKVTIFEPGVEQEVNPKGPYFNVFKLACKEGYEFWK